MDRNPGARPLDVRLLLQACGAALILAGLSRSTGSQLPLAAAATVGGYVVYVNRPALRVAASALASRATARAGRFACLIAACAFGSALAVDSGNIAVAFAGNVAMIGAIAVAIAGGLALALRLSLTLLPHLGGGGRRIKDSASLAWLLLTVALTAGRGDGGGQPNSRRSHL
jgi:hypothetical protein